MMLSSGSWDTAFFIALPPMFPSESRSSNDGWCAAGVAGGADAAPGAPPEKKSKSGAADAGVGEGGATGGGGGFGAALGCGGAG